MLRACKFADGRYGIVNIWTGIILTNNKGQTLTYRSQKKAERQAIRRERMLANVIKKVNRNG